jgi:hypothetical protein
MAINELIRRVLLCKEPNPRGAYIAPFYKQAKNVAWDYLRQFTQDIPGVKFNQSELKVDFPNGARIQLYGGDNPDSLRGIYLDCCVMDEYAQCPPRLWTEVLRPALADRKGSALFIGTPYGRGNAFYDLYQLADKTNDWYRALLTANDTGVIDPDELQAAKDAMSDEEFNQEFLCSWDAAIRGAFFGKAMDLATAEGRITKVPYDETMQVITAWDLGINDATAIWFAQMVGSEIRFIDYQEYQGMSIPAIIRELDKKPYRYSRHIAPHDIKVRELGTGTSRWEVALKLGLRFDVARQLPVIDGIDAVRSMLGRCWFDEKACFYGLEALRAYRTEYDDKKRVFSNAPLHDWSSHGADAMRYFAVEVGARNMGLNSQYELDYSKLNRAAI